MFGRATIVLALIVYATVLGCVLVPAASPARGATDAKPAAQTPFHAPLTGLPICGAGMQIQRVDWIDQYKKSMDEIAARGGDSVLLVVDTRMENGTSSRIYLDMRMTPTPDQLGDLIDHAKKLKLRVILMPIVLLDNPKGNEWRGTIHPENWEDWWDSYRDAVAGHFAWIAQAHGVDIMVIGSELVSTESKVDEWTKTIDAVRKVFKGKLTYSSNWDHYTSIHFWKQLDLVGMNSYWNLGEVAQNKIPREKLTVDTIKTRWKEIQSDLVPFIRKTGKPLLFLEIGWCSLANAAHEPWDYTKESEPIDNELQKMLYQAFFESWWGKPYLAGFMIWEWAPGDGGKGDESEKRGYTPENKPAEEVLKQWLAKPRWEVK